MGAGAGQEARQEAVTAPPDKDHCQEKSRLAGEFARAAESYSNAASALRAAIHRDHLKILEEISAAHDECAKARRALQSHILKHRC